MVDANMDIRVLMLKSGVKSVDIANALGIHQTTVSRQLGKEMDDATKMMYRLAIAQARTAKERRNGGGSDGE